MALRPGFLAGTLIASALLASACRHGAVAEVEWTGADTGQAALVARAERCDNVWRLFATAGDTGLAILVYPNGKRLEPGMFPVLAPTEAQQTRPAAAFAARWTDSQVVSGYRGVEGTIQLRRAAPTLSGEFRALARRDGDLREVTFHGRFADVDVTACQDSAG